MISEMIKNALWRMGFFLVGIVIATASIALVTWQVELLIFSLIGIWVGCYLMGVGIGEDRGSEFD